MIVQMIEPKRMFLLKKIYRNTCCIVYEYLFLDNINYCYENEFGINQTSAGKFTLSQLRPGMVLAIALCCA